MIDCAQFYQYLLTKNIQFFCGVPDSLLKDFCAYITDHTPEHQHIINANEGNSIAIATGYYLATQNLPLVYMQNSGLGNAINPLTSLTDKEVYGIPMLLMIGWRGHPDTPDEPQHIKMGRINPALLKTLEIPYAVLPDTWNELDAVVSSLLQNAYTDSTPVALLIKTDTFSSYKLQKKIPQVNNGLNRETALSILVDYIDRQKMDNVVYIATTGKLSRELYEYRDAKNQSHEQDFLTVGSMGHASQIALGIAIAQPDKTVICLDGDGALLMHAGSLSTIGMLKPKNLIHIVFNNWSHDSVGGQPTAASQSNIALIAHATGYRKTLQITDKALLVNNLDRIINEKGPLLLEILVESGSRSNLGRPKTQPNENKTSFMKTLASKNK
ncbi:MAG: phosphonopyruvate decarboxylase [Pseudomonadota bacterium]